MLIQTSRFGKIDIEHDDVITFVQGLIGMESCRRWVLLADAKNETLGWLQSVDHFDIALAVVSPRRFIHDYQIRISSRDLLPLRLPSPSAAEVLVILTRAGDSLALNLKAPLVINVEARLGRQLVAKDDHAVQYVLNATVRLRQTA